MIQDASNEQLLKLLFNMKQEISSYKKETEEKISNLENTILMQQKLLKEKDNEIVCLKQSIVEIKKEHAIASSIMEKEISELKKENIKLKKTIKEKDDEINRLNNKINKLEKNNTKLENQLSKNSSNSSKPSSTDGFHKIVHSLRNKSNNPVGGQKNHIGTTLITDKVMSIIGSEKKNVIVENKILYVNNKKLDGKVKYEIDTQLSVVVTKYTLAYKKEAEMLPKELKNTVTYGKNIKSLVALLNVEHAISVQRTVDIIRELTDNVLNISTGTVVNILYELKEKIAPFIGTVKDFLLRCEVNHKDETMLYCNGEPRWFHVFSNKDATYYYYHKNRGNKADVEKGVLNIFTGTLVHDHMKGLYRFQCDDAECNAHILRYLEYTTERYKRNWSDELKKLLLTIKKEIEEEMKKGYNSLRTESILKYEQEYTRIVEKGAAEFRADSNIHKDYAGEDMQLLRRLTKYKENHLAFMYDFRIPFDNNLAERDLRMIKAKKKISGGFRSDNGGEAYTDAKSYLSTMRKQGKNLYSSLVDAFNNNPICMTL